MNYKEIDGWINTYLFNKVYRVNPDYEDVKQECWRCLLQAAPRFDETKSSFKTFAFYQFWWAYTHYVKKRPREGHCSLSWVECADDTEDGYCDPTIESEIATHFPDTTLFDLGSERLDVTDQLLLHLYIAGYTEMEISKKIDTPRSTVGMKLNQLKDKLRERVRRLDERHG